MKWSVAFLAVPALLAVAVRADGHSQVEIPVNGNARITVSSCFDSLSISGYAPVNVTINNGTGATREWTFEFQSPGGGWNSTDTLQSSFTIQVENNGTRTTTLLVPTKAGENGQTPLGVTAKGYGLVDGIEQTLGDRSWSGKPRTPYVVMSESLGTGIWSDLVKRVDNSGSDLLGSTVNPDDLPEDWRGLSGIAGMWMTGDELNKLDPAQRDAILTWVHAGGWLTLCRVLEAPKDFRDAGFGHVRTLPGALDSTQNIETTILSGELPAMPAYSGAFKGGTAAEKDELMEVTPNVPLLFGVMAIFAVVVGPLNIWVLARRRRERLFWTTPVISVCASGMLMGMIVMQDGIGGHGLRAAVVCVFPESHNEVVTQEELSRCGLLLGSGFQTRDPVVVRQLDISQFSPMGAKSTGRGLKNEGTTFHGQWFESRAAQAQRIVEVTPTRAEITVVNAADARDKGASPAIVSSFGGTLDLLVYTDGQNRQWTGSAVRTGQEQTLKPATVKNPGMASQLIALGGGKLGDLATQAGYFYATSADGHDYVETLGSIHWHDDPIIYVGPVTANP